MENMDKELTVPKCVLVVWLDILQMSQNLSAQCVCPSPKVLDFYEKRLHLESIVRAHIRLIFFDIYLSEKIYNQNAMQKDSMKCQ